jgi:hypothetical protein
MIEIIPELKYEDSSSQSVEFENASYLKNRV